MDHWSPQKVADWVRTLNPQFGLYYRGIVSAKIDGQLLSKMDADPYLWEVAGIHNTSHINTIANAVCDRRQTVFLHIYSVSDSVPLQWLNWLTADVLGLGGVFHVSVEVYGKEFYYGLRDEGKGTTVTGISEMCPENPWIFAHMSTIDLGKTPFSEKEVEQMVLTMRPKWRGDTYHLLANNCCDFAEEFCSRLATAGVPPWVNRFARLGTGLKTRAGRCMGQCYKLDKSMIARGWQRRRRRRFHADFVDDDEAWIDDSDYLLSK